MSRISGTSSKGYSSWGNYSVRGAQSTGRVSQVQRVGRVGQVTPVEGTGAAQGSSFAEIFARKLYGGQAEADEGKQAPRTYVYAKEELDDFQGTLYGFSSRRATDIPVTA